MKGAESVVSKTRFLGVLCLKKDRIEKAYRNGTLDMKLRTERTRQEVRLLHKAKKAGLSAPTVLFVSQTSFLMTKMPGKLAKLHNESECFQAGQMLANLHANEMIHGDYTKANLLESKGKLSVIDFGLGFFSKDIEDKAIDVITMLDNLANQEQRNWFLQGYRKENGQFGSILKRIEGIRKRARYA